MGLRSLWFCSPEHKSDSSTFWRKTRDAEGSSNRHQRFLIPLSVSQMAMGQPGDNIQAVLSNFGKMAEDVCLRNIEPGSADDVLMGV